VVAMIDLFTERGLAERRKHPRDRRAYSIFLTERGAEVLEEAEVISRQASDALFRNLTSQEREQLGRLMRAVVGDGGR
jgi:DNA-binding MarR family transcriptional regulator